MSGLVPAIHALFVSKDVDARHKAGHDEGEAFRGGYFQSTFLIE